MYYADEVRSLADVPTGGEPKVRANELQMAERLIEQLASDDFQPEKYKDEYRERVQEVVQKKVAGEEVRVAEPEKPRAQVIDLMEALKASLSRRDRAPERPTVAEREATGKRRPTARSRDAERPAPRRRAHKK
jgi:DNA end-binding protein Ku